MNRHPDFREIKGQENEGELPLVLVVDDELGIEDLFRDTEGIDTRWTERAKKRKQEYCRNLGLLPADDPGLDVERPVARAKFVSCLQWMTRLNAIPDPDLLIQEVQAKRSTSPPGYALMLLDLMFDYGAFDRESGNFGLRSPAYGIDVLLPALGKAFGLDTASPGRGWSAIPVVVVSSLSKNELDPRIRAAGARGMLEKRASPETMREALSIYLTDHGLLSDDKAIIAGHSIALLNCLAAARRAAQANLKVLLLGETGTGKELLARYVHDHSLRKQGPYCVFHVPGRAETLQEDELFGHVRGAYTGAQENRPGLLELASGGTLFVDEIADVDPGHQEKGKYAHLVREVVCGFPEVTFRFIEIEVDGCTGKGLAKLCHNIFSTCEDPRLAPGTIAGIAGNFSDGQRDLYDTAGLRFAIRQGEWNGAEEEKLEIIKKELGRVGHIPSAYILEDERDYADLVSYCAYRSGLYRVRQIPMRNLEGFQLGAHLDGNSGGALIHAWDIPNWEAGKRRRTFADLDLATKQIRRMVITGASEDELNVIEPKYWKKKNDYIAWEDGTPPRLRGLRKPLGWIHDIQESGLLRGWNAGTQDCNAGEGLVKSFFDGHNPATDRVPTAQGHSALPECQRMAQRLLTRSRTALRNDEPLLGAVLALEAMRWLRGRSATLFLDCLQTLYEAETELEVNVASSGRSSQATAPRIRAKEATDLVDMLSKPLAGSKIKAGDRELEPDRPEAEPKVNGALVGKNGQQPAQQFDAKIATGLPDNATTPAPLHQAVKAEDGLHSPLMPRLQVPEVKERIWTALRQRYLDVGAFEPAEEALAFIHEAHRERIGMEDVGLKKCLAELGALIKEFTRTSIPKAWDAVKQCMLSRLSHDFIYFPKTLRGTALSWVVAFLSVILILEAPLVNPSDPCPWWCWVIGGWATALTVLCALVFIWTRSWPRVALEPRRWIEAAVLSILALSAGNLALLPDPSSVKVITEHRIRAYAESMGWTLGSALAQTMPGKFIHSDTVSAGNEERTASSLSFGWRGATTKPVNSNDDPDLRAVQSTQAARTFLWLENVIAGWLTFATGLSTLYRRASR